MIDDDALRRLLAEDVPYGDLTTGLLGIGDRPGRIVFAARTPMVTCATEEAARLFQLGGATLCAEIVPSGQPVPAGRVLLAADGSAGALHAVWKVAQVLVETMSGIATATRALVDQARAVNPAVCVACTRKSFPGTRALAVRAILAGGAVPHRLGLSDSILVFAEHRAFLPAGGAEADWIGRLKAAAPERKVAVEVTTADQALAFATAGADIIQTEKFTPEAVRALAERLRIAAPAVVLAAAGGIDQDNAAAYAQAGARVLVSSAPYHAKPAEVQVSLAATGPTGAGG
jgi:molybdenum transport protein